MLDYPTEIYSDESLVVINKPAGVVAHEGAGETGETVVDWFIKNYPEVAHESWPDPTRPGIVHRLDKDTSGAMVIAKNPEILAELQTQFKDRTTQKIYYAVVFGEPREDQGTIETFIGRHPKRRQEQTVLPVPRGKQARREAVTHFTVQKSWEVNAGKEKGIVSLIKFEPKTGRMHQLRVHAKHIGTPIIGDPVYNTKLSKHLSKALGLEHQLLHAQSLTFRHPTTHKRMTFETPIPNEITRLM